jgi:hypothetical protein
MKDYPDGEGKKQKVYLVPEWAALEAIDKNLTGSLDIANDTDTQLLTYSVLPGETLYVVQFGALVKAASNIVVWMTETWGLNVLTRAVSGGASGFSSTLNKPLVITDEHTVNMVVRHFAGASKVCIGYIMGYIL